MKVGKKGVREIIYLSLHCRHQNDFCIKMGSDESHFNVVVVGRFYIALFSALEQTYYARM